MVETMHGFYFHHKGHAHPSCLHLKNTWALQEILIDYFVQAIDSYVKMPQLTCRKIRWRPWGLSSEAKSTVPPFGQLKILISTDLNPANEPPS